MDYVKQDSDKIREELTEDLKSLKRRFNLGDYMGDRRDLVAQTGEKLGQLLALDYLTASE